MKARSMETINIYEAPEGFFAVYKDSAQTPNVCNSCDAKKLCQGDKDDWCLINRCMPFEITAFKDGKGYGREDGQSVIFKQIKPEEIVYL